MACERSGVRSPSAPPFSKYSQRAQRRGAQFAMDVAGVSPYMRRHTMKWLLVLSALFSTLTGVSVGARPLEAAVQQSALSAGIRRHVSVAVPLARGHVHLLGAYGIGQTFAGASHLPAIF